MNVKSNAFDICNRRPSVSASLFDYIGHSYKEEHKLMKTVDLVVPCYNEEDGLSVFVEETTKVTETIKGYKFRFILVNDGSKDNT